MVSGQTVLGVTFFDIQKYKLIIMVLNITLKKD